MRCRVGLRTALPGVTLLVLGLGVGACADPPESPAPPSPPPAPAETPPPAPAPPAARGAYEVTPLQFYGGISGEITVIPIPRSGPVEVDRDREVCGQYRLTDESAMASASGGLANVVVRLVGVTKGKPWLQRSTPELTLSQCRFDPHVLLLDPGEGLKLRNLDGILYQVRSLSRKNPPLSVDQPGYQKEVALGPGSFAEPEFIGVWCDAHAWMSAVIVVTDSPYYTVTNRTGTFKLSQIPPGPYTLEFWHERYGSRTREVRVQANQVIDMTERFVG